MANIFVADGAWFLHRCWYTLRTNRPIEEALPYAFLGLICKDACAVRATHLLVAFDGPSVFRYDVYPEYKADRKAKKGAKSHSDEEQGKDIYAYLPAVRKYLSQCGVTWVQPKKYEGDDVLASAAVQYSESSKVTLGARDKDIYQVLSPCVSMYDSCLDTPAYIRAADAERAKGVPVSAMVAYQMLIGDPTDNVPSLMGPATARKVIREWGTINNWFKGSKKDRIWLRTNQAKLETNKKLVTLVRDLALPDVESLVVPKLKLDNMPAAWYAYQMLLYPKSKGIFSKR